MIAFCLRCGAELPTELAGEWFAAAVRCSECGLAPARPPAVLAPSADEVDLDLGDWTVADRAAITAALAEVDIPYRWQADLVLAVPAGAEADVDRLLDGLGPGAVTPGLDGAAEATDGDELDGGEEARAAMEELFLAADRLQHAPADTRAIATLARAAATVGACLPPYGMDGVAWRRIHELASTLAATLGPSADADTVAADARQLRDLLHHYV